MKKDQVEVKSRKIRIIGTAVGAIVTLAGTAVHITKKHTEKETYIAEAMEPIENRKRGFYEKYVKRGLDIACGTAAIACFAPLYLGVAGLVKLDLGSPILFTQDRPGLIDKSGKETVFKMYKFRTMTDERDEDGNLLSDEERLTKFGSWLRSTSLDELPEVINILNGTMSVIGPRPQLVRDMVFMTQEQRQRHTAKPGLSGLAQVNGRNAINWESKLQYDQEYLKNVSFIEDLKLIIKTVEKAFIKREGITEENAATAADYGDYLVSTNRISSETYEERQALANIILKG